MVGPSHRHYFLSYEQTISSFEDGCSSFIPFNLLYGDSQEAPSSSAYHKGQSCLFPALIFPALMETWLRERTARVFAAFLTQYNSNYCLFVHHLLALVEPSDIGD